MKAAASEESGFLSVIGSRLSFSDRPVSQSDSVFMGFPVLQFRVIDSVKDDRFSPVVYELNAFIAKGQAFANEIDGTVDAVILQDSINDFVV